MAQEVQEVNLQYLEEEVERLPVHRPVGLVVRLRPPESVVGLPNRLEWALQAEPVGRLQREPGRVAEGAARFPFALLYRRNGEKATATAGLAGELFTTPTPWHPK